MQTVFHLFVYGSLRSGFKSPAYNYVSKYFTFVANATVKGVLYNMGEYPLGQPTEEEKYIIGELYSINNTDEFGFAIAQLDDYEGVNGDEDEAPLFVRDTTTVYHHDGKTTEAWVYWFIGDTSEKPLIESGDVLAFLSEKQNGH
jgi:gamma-glutamylcyclotransferase (GGCT)/AIG2-like uncharacterized protein YtfP